MTYRQTVPRPETGAQSLSLRSDSTFFFREGSKLYMEQDYGAAAVSYQKARDLEKQHRGSHWSCFECCSSIGDVDGMTAKLPQAKTTFEYGITQDSQYPMFYYNVACTYGEMAKMHEALDQLRLAYKYKANMIAGETFTGSLRLFFRILWTSRNS